MGTSKFNAGGNPAMDQHPIYEGVTLSLKIENLGMNHSNRDWRSFKIILLTVLPV